jgi:two-component system sensor histidine kinase KdpD
VVGVALVGGLYPALAAAIAGFLLLNYYFIPPLHKFTIAERENVLALVVFLGVAIAVSAVVDRAAHRSAEAAAARAEAETLSTLAGSVLRGSRPLTALLDQLRETFGFTSVTLLQRRADAAPTALHSDPAAWRVAAAVGDRPCASPDEGDVEIPTDDDLVLVLRGHPLAARHRRTVEAFAAQAAMALRQETLRAAANGHAPAEVAPVAEDAQTPPDTEDLLDRD